MRRLLLVVLFLLLWAPAAQAWTWPVRGPVMQGFSFDKEHPYADGQHRGIDIGSSGGVPVLAPSSGTVTFAGSVPGSGLCVTIETADGLAVTLTHLGSASVGRGATIDEGAAVGVVGTSTTPEVAGPYVHLGIRVASDPNGYLDPLSLLPPATVVGSPGPAPGAGPAPAPQQSSAGSTPAAAGSSPTTIASSATAPPAASGPAAGASAPVTVLATDFAPHPAAASAGPAPSPVSRAMQTAPASGANERGAAVVMFPPARRTRLARTGRRDAVSAQRVARAPDASVGTRPVPVSATPRPRHRPAAGSPRALDGGEGVDAIPMRPQDPAPPVARASRSTTPAAPPWLLPALAGAVLSPLLVLGALFRRRQGAPAARPHLDGIVMPLPLAPRPEPVRERLAA